MKALLLAVAFISGLAAQQPDSRSLLQRGLAAEKAGRAAEAMRTFRDVLRAAPPPEVEGQARLELVRISMRRADWWSASEHLEALRGLAPAEAEYAYQLGVVYRNLSKASFEQMQSLAPQSARVKQAMGEQLAAAGDTEKAVQAFQQAVAADPKLAGSHLALALIYLRANKRDRAREEIDRELAIAPESAVAKQVRQAIAGGER